MKTLLRLPSPPRVLSAGATLWFVTATLGQWAFVAFIALFFGGAVATGDFAGLNAKPHVTGYVPDDLVGNTQFLGHALLGGLVTLAGTWQLIPALRRRWPAVHRWNGRLFLAVALMVTFTGFWLVWARGSRLGIGSDVSITLNGLLIVACAVLAWRSAGRRDFAAHRRHALRAWLLVNGVWFLRIGIMLAGLVLTPLGITIDYQGATFILVSFASWLLPLVVLELYFRAERARPVWAKIAMGSVLGLLALLTLAGSLAAAAFMWWPVL
ncbi:DUF2306 domain-containing protein [Pseudoxanthomonas sp. PXM02]|uniref:DUF2306 domain-containing protein n=1 Tax=Pseudoxanthomonas sp. PXM02 TaxID=2769294 RepID=UPI00177B8841|nr:DUF2306 domain-containing protein [Pseudoxanthomonas sp. PXM02]MBD9477671.1 DUF2306 domain-containing protein [Pseudoxanthomonas sp. PXM02]